MNASSHWLLRAVLGAILVSALVLPATASLAQQEADGPAVRRGRELVKILNSGDRAAIEEFVTSSMGDEMRNAFPMEQHVSVMRGVHEDGAPYEITDIEDHGDQAELTLHSTRTDAWLTLRLAVEPNEPHLVEGIGMRPATAPPPEPTGDSYTDREIGEALDAAIADMVAVDRFSGTVMLARGDQIVYQTARGEADKDFSVPNDIDTKFNLGSMNKMFTAVAIAQLVERGQLSFDDPLSKFLPEFPDAESAAKIQIKHLLSHTSGLGSYFNDKFMNSSRALYRNVSDLMTLAEGETLQFEPGTRWSYSNTGFLVLGRVIEVVTGQDYYDYIRDNVTGPAGMDSTDCYELDHVNPNLAVGYDRQDGPDGPVWVNNLFMHVIRGGPAGGGYSTVGDLVRFANALRANTLIRADTFHVLTTPKPELSSPDYGYGFGIEPDGGVGHSGGFPGINSHLVFWPDGEWTIAVMSNVSGGAEPVVRLARKLVMAGAER